MRAATKAMRSVASQHGLLPGPTAGKPAATPSGELVEGLSDSWFDLYADLLRERALYALGWEPRLTAILRAILGPEAIPHPCAIFRMVAPGTEAYTKTRLIRTCGTWADTRRFGRRGSHAASATAALAGSKCCPARTATVSCRCAGSSGAAAVCPPDLHWRWTPMQPGDVLLFSSFTVHRGVANTSGNGLRMSADFRYQSATEPFRLEALQPHARILSWDDVYQGWEGTDELRYYWRRRELRVHPG